GAGGVPAARPHRGDHPRARAGARARPGAGPAGPLAPRRAGAGLPERPGRQGRGARGRAARGPGVTAGAPTPALLLPSQVAELLQTMVKALRAFQIYLPNNPIYHRAVENVRQAFGPIWSAVDELVLSVGETELRWENEVVYSQISKADSLAWVLCKDGMRVLSIKRGAEEEEVVRLLEVINRARFLPHEASDDLMTLLWEQDFQFIQYHFVDFEGEGEALQGSLLTAAAGGGAGPGGEGEQDAAQARQAQIREEAPPEALGIVQLEDFDSTLYFLEPGEIDYVAAQLQEEYGRDVRASALNALFDIFELQS